MTVGIILVLCFIAMLAAAYSIGKLNERERCRTIVKCHVGHENSVVSVCSSIDTRIVGPASRSVDR